MINYSAPAIGIVVDTNDPTQNGRVRVVVPSWMESADGPVEEGEWAKYVSPYGGTVSSMTRGPGIQQSKGGVTYGFWAIPKIGSQVVVICFNGNPARRAYIGCMYDEYSTNSLPHGRFMYDDHPALEKNGEASKPAGPYTNGDGFLEPLSTNMKMAFKNTGGPNFEWQSRAADYCASAVDVDNINDSFSQVPDDKEVEHNGRLYTQGYQRSRTDPHSEATSQANQDSQVMCMVSPGFHAMSMDDRQENCRMRLRSTSGHQIILDDTNERIYISTAQGNNYIEMDMCGNIDIYSNKKINVRSTDDINFMSDKSIKLTAKENVHINAGKEFRVTSKEDMHIKTPKNINIKSDNMFFDIKTNVNVTIGNNLKISAAEEIDISCKNMFQSYSEDLHINSKNTYLSSSESTNITATDFFLTTEGTVDISSGSTIQLKSTTSTAITSTTTMEIFGTVSTTITGGGATARFMAGVMTYPATPPAIIAVPTEATEATPSTMPDTVTTLTAFLSNRIPDHEPWGRCSTKEKVEDPETLEKGDFSEEPEMAYDDPQMGKIERGISILRGMFWRR